ncbi:MAG TPA: M20/M25/M40 family metallo-hydrolase [Caulobacteraceae bacterium]|jgi:hypothetical protein
MKAWAALAACLLTGLALAWFASATPAPAPADASAQAFSAERAMRDVREISQRPRPTGSPENARVRAYLVQRLQGLGLQVRVARSVGRPQPNFRPTLGETADIHNIVAIMPGKDPRLPALAVMSHYDSVRGSPGAADDAAGVAASLEIARAIRATGRPERDVVFLITDGEEMGLVGAFNFFPHEDADRRMGPPDPLAARIGAVLNMESRGGGGRAWMFETGFNNGQMIELLQANAVRPSSNSLAVYVYGQMANATDLSVSKHGAKLPGLNWAFIGRPAQYHTAASTPENLDVGSVQHIGEQVLAATKALAFSRTLPRQAPDAVYSDVLGSFLLAYPAWAGWLVLAAAGALIVYALWRQRRATPRVGWTDLLQGAGGAIAVLLGAALLMRLARRLTGLEPKRVEYYELLARFGVYETALALLGLAAALLAFSVLARGRARLWTAAGALLAGAACSVAGVDLAGAGLGLVVAVLALLVAGRPLGLAGAWGGFLLVGLSAAGILQVIAPTTAFIVAWPLLLSAAAAAVYASVRREGLCLLVAIVLGALALGQIGGWAHGIALGIGATMPEALGVFALLAALAAAPLLHRAGAERAGRYCGAALLVAGLALIVWIRFAGPSGMPAPLPYKPVPAEAS